MGNEKVKLTFLGSGSAFTLGFDNYHSNMILEKNHKHFLIDCGSDARFALFELGLSHRDIDSVYVSHLHADHVGGLEWLAFASKFNSTAGTKINLFLSETISDAIWDNVLSGGLSSLEESDISLSTYFNVHPIKESDRTFTWEGVQFQLIQSIHCMTGSKPMPSFGLIFKNSETKVLISGDTRFRPDVMMKFYHEADLIFHDCETSKCPSGVHSPYKDLCTLPPEIKRKMWLYHYNPGDLPDAIADGFKGFVKKGQSFEFNGS